MRALVTGSAGFIGRHMVAELQARGYSVDKVDTTYEAPPEQGVIAYDARAIFDECCPEECHQIAYDLVVHCAYHVGGRASIDGVNTNFAKNLQLDAAMFDWAVRTQQKRVLYFSSSAAYPVYLQTEKDHAHYGPMTEDEIDLGHCEEPDANYGWAKLTGERLAEDARKNGLDVTVVRPFSGYGEDQGLEYPFPSIVQRASQGNLTVWGPPGQTRDWIHVSDVVGASLAVVDSGTKDPVNLCTGRGVEMGELAKTISETNCVEDSFKNPDSDICLCGPDVTYDESKPTGVFYRVGDPTRMLQYYTPKVSLEEGIQKALKAQTKA